MAGVSDKARFFLEQSVPELKEYERKGIFTSDEIARIAQKRSEFEHKLNARECTPPDYARYAEFEINVDSLRRKRVKRLRVKAPAHTGQRRLFFILDRATRKFPGDIGLWMQQIEYARQQKAYKRLSQILTKALRLHPSKPDLWIYAGHIAMEEHADMIEARSYMQRGLRFCKGSESLWLEYMKLELLYIAKITARQQILGIDQYPEPPNENRAVDDEDADVVGLQGLTAEDIHTSDVSMHNIDPASPQKLAKTPALSGAIPIAIFDAAMLQLENDDEVALKFFDTVQEIDPIPCLQSVLQHIVDHMLSSQPSNWRTLVCSVKVPCVGVAVTSPEFPKRFGISLKRLQKALLGRSCCIGLIESIREWLEILLENDSLDVALRQVVVSILQQLKAAAESSHAA
ncbi:hypothetical protein GJ744_012333 [Endocarpon pusillum]|uniref:U3 small nucleolar RNA-associated protein 6 N-terminal domain-containing protein n=1 Tax=Endocarpon pusillum TaxID=364733 RepID=A0A8H7AF59_9EURO|nr:hypothetical protein GJ744_012333 [Endocarpon pusillum]